MADSSEHERRKDTPGSARRAPHTPIVQAYAGEAADELPIGGYIALMVVFVGAFGALAAAARARNRLQRVAARDLVLAGIAVHKLSRTVTRDRVTAPLRVPFTHYAGTDGAGQVNDEPRGRGIQRAVGTLLTCQYCTGPWLAMGVTAGLLFAPRVTRLANSVLSVATLSDFLHQAYAGARRWST
jgi:hypothetical protein